MFAQHLLCRLADLPVGQSRGFARSANAPYADVLVVRTENGCYAYRNRCPHTLAPMEWLPDQFLDIERHWIQCGIHGALFRIEDGYCVQGPCVGQSLVRVALAVQDDHLIALEPLENTDG